MSDARVTELLDREAIRELKARYLEAMDVHDWDAFRRTLTEDARMELLGREFWPLAPIKADPLDGAEVFVTATQMALDSARSVHHGHTSEVTFPSADRAHGYLVLRDYIEWAPDPHTGERRGMRGYGIYDEDFRKLDGKWKISGWRLTYIRTDPLRRAQLPGPQIGGPEDAANFARVHAAYSEFHSSPDEDRVPLDVDALVQGLVDREAIRELKARYYNYADAQQWEQFRDVFTDGLEVDLAAGQTFDSADEYVAAVKRLTVGAVTVHHGHMPQIRIDDAHSARGTWMLGTYVDWSRDAASGARHGARVYGYQRERYQRINGKWRIAAIHQSYLRSDPLPPTPLS